MLSGMWFFMFCPEICFFVLFGERGAENMAPVIRWNLSILRTKLCLQRWNCALGGKKYAYLGRNSFLFWRRKFAALGVKFCALGHKITQFPTLNFTFGIKLCTLNSGTKLHPSISSGVIIILIWGSQCCANSASQIIIMSLGYMIHVCFWTAFRETKFIISGC